MQFHLNNVTKLLILTHFSLCLPFALLSKHFILLCIFLYFRRLTFYKTFKIYFYFSDLYF